MDDNKKCEYYGGYNWCQHIDGNGKCPCGGDPKKCGIKDVK